MLKTQYVAIRDKLSEIEELQEVDWYTGQDRQNGDQTWTVSAGAYIRFRPVTEIDHYELIQKFILQIDIILLTDNVQDGEGMVLTTHSDIFDAIFKKLNYTEYSLVDVNPDFPDFNILGNIQRTGFEVPHSLSNIVKSVQIFKAVATDYTDALDYDQVIYPTIQLTPYIAPQITE